MRAAIFPLLAVLGSACAQLPRGEVSTAPLPTRGWLVGAWVPEGESCESDAGVHYRRDGTWVAYESAGTWRFEGSTIVSVVTEGADEVAGLERASNRHVQSVEILGPDTFRSRWEDGSTVELHRCPTEPS